MARASGTFTGVGAAASIPTAAKFPVAVKDLNGGTVIPQYSWDKGVTWFNADPITSDSIQTAESHRKGAEFRLYCSVFVSGTISYEYGDDDVWAS